MPVGPLYLGLPPLDTLGLPPAVANIADLEMEERSGGISLASSARLVPSAVVVEKKRKRVIK